MKQDSLVLPLLSPFTSPFSFSRFRLSPRLARAHGFKRLKLYMMVGLPEETEEDIDELIAFSLQLAKRVPLSLGIAPFCAKRNTPLDGAPFAGIDVVERRLKRLRRGVKGKVDLRATSARWAWVEYVLAQGGQLVEVVLGLARVTLQQPHCPCRCGCPLTHSKRL